MERVEEIFKKKGIDIDIEILYPRFPFTCKGRVSFTETNPYTLRTCYAFIENPSEYPESVFETSFKYDKHEPPNSGNTYHTILGPYRKQNDFLYATKYKDIHDLMIEYFVGAHLIHYYMNIKYPILQIRSNIFAEMILSITKTRPTHIPFMFLSCGFLNILFKTLSSNSFYNYSAETFKNENATLLKNIKLMKETIISQRDSANYTEFVERSKNTLKSEYLFGEDDEYADKKFTFLPLIDHKIVNDKYRVYYCLKNMLQHIGLYQIDLTPEEYEKFKKLFSKNTETKLFKINKAIDFSIVENEEYFSRK